VPCGIGDHLEMQLRSALGVQGAATLAINDQTPPQSILRKDAAMCRFTIRDVLWLTVVVGLTLSWWIDSRRIETAVVKLESDRRDLQAEFDDKLWIVNEMQIKAKKELDRATRLSSAPTSPSPLSPKSTPN
jgi:hypothetical protein